MKKLFFAFLLLSISVLSARSQMMDPVKWTYSVETVSECEYYLVFKAKIDEGWHLYSQFVEEGGPLPTEFNYSSTEGFTLLDKALEIPAPKKEYEEAFMMDVLYFDKKQTFKQKIKLKEVRNITISGEIAYMACNDETCVPLYKDFSFNIITSEANADEIIIEPDDTASTLAADTTIVNDSLLLAGDVKICEDSLDASDASSDDISDIKDLSLWAIFWIAFGWGLIAIFTPCVLPMIPMTVTFFMKGSENKAKGRRQAFTYGLSIIIIFTVIGSLLAIIFGPNFFQWLSTHWIPNIIFFLIFMVFAASFFGWFEIRMPTKLINKTDQQADKGGILGPFFMAFTLVLVSFSCTVPIIGAVVVWLADGQFIQPIVIMFGFGMAFALPFTIFALFPRWLSSLPKSGGWMNNIKVVLGFIELAFGLKFLSVADLTYHWGILDREIFLAIWIVIFFLMGLYLLGKIKFRHDSDVAHVSVPRLALVIVTFSFVVYMIPGMFGAPLKMLSGFIPPQTTHDFDIREIVRDELNTMQIISSSNASQGKYELCDPKPKYSDFLHLPHGLKGYFDYDQGIACAKERNKPVFIDFTGHGCVNCRKMEDQVWAEPEVLKRLRNDYLIITLYTDDKTTLAEEEWVPASESSSGKVIRELGRKLADFQIKRFGQNSQPQYVLLDTNGEKLINETKGYNPDVADFIRFLDAGLKEFEKRHK